MEKTRPNWAKRAADFYQRREFRSAALAFRANLIQTPASHHSMLMFARSLEKVNPHSPFRHYARKATVLAPGNAATWRMLAQGAFNRRELGRAASAARRQIVLEPGDLSGNLMLSRARFDGGDLDLCWKALRRAGILAPYDKFVGMAQARCLFRRGDHGAALSFSEKAMDLGGSIKEFGFDHARIAHAADRPDIFIPCLDQLVGIDESYARKRQILELTISVDDLRPRRP